MTDKDLIYLYAEGGLTESEEARLLARLAEDPALRSEMRSVNKMNSAIRQHFVMPEADMAEADKIMKLAGMTSKKIPPPPATGTLKITGLCALALLTGYLLYPLLSGGKHEAVSIGTMRSDAPVSRNMESSLGNEKEYIMTNEHEKVSVVGYEKRLTARHEQNEHDRRAMEFVTATETELVSSEEKAQQTWDALTLSDVIGAGYEYQVDGHIPTGAYEAAELPAIDMDDQSGERISLKLFGTLNRHFPAATVEPGTKTMFPNQGLQVLYSFSERLQAGAEVRQETFFQQYTGLSEYASLNRYEQQPNLTTFSAVLDYMLPLYGDFAIYMQPMAGFNKAGIVLGAGAGAGYALSDALRLELGLEYRYLNFRHQQERFFATKAALTCGIRYGF